MKDKAGEYAEQAKSTANQAANKAREGKLRYWKFCKIHFVLI
jgi:hypothetical protein